MGSYYVMGTEFLFGKVKMSWKWVLMMTVNVLKTTELLKLKWLNRF